MFTPSLQNKILSIQRAEMTEHCVYKKLSRLSHDPRQKEIMLNIADKELSHYQFWKAHTNREVTQNRLKTWWYVGIARVCGLTFGLKLMERDEDKAELAQDELAQLSPGADQHMKDEAHELVLIDSIAEERLKYMGSMVLGLNDALVELTGALAGFTLALQSVRLIAFTGLITGISAALSMAASEYLSTKTEGESKAPLTASLYTGSVYLFAVLLLILPYFIFDNLYLCLGSTILIAIALIVVFTFYIAVAKEISFKKRFFEMAPVTLGIAALTFFIGFLVKTFFQLEV